MTFSSPAVVCALLGLSSLACGHHADQPAAASAAGASATDDVPAAAKGTGGVPLGYARPAPLASPTDRGNDGGTRTSSNGLANPGPTANPCSRDDECITHRCNGAFHRCAFPCVSDRDCIAGNYCYTSVVAVCLPRASGTEAVDGG
jgi:hypothetical protein